MFPSFNVLCGAAERCCQGHGTDAPIADVIDPERLGMDAGQARVEPSFSDLPPVEEESTESIGPMVTPARTSIRFNKMSNMRHMEIDEEFTRGISLHRALRHPELWTSPLEIRRKNQTAKVWNLSKKVSNFDTFLSHTWRTKGRWKVLALMIQIGWLHGMLAWSIGLAMMLCFRGFDIISDPWKTVIFPGGQPLSIPLNPWTIVVSELALLIGVYVSPYLPIKTQICFFDVACIHQGQSEMFERGIYGIGGCLAVAEELQVLYTSQYLSSLWCVFEIVGFRKVKPEGRLTLSPLFVERSSLICSLIMFHTTFLFYIILHFVDTEFRTRYNAVLYGISFLLPIMFVVHTMRFNYREKTRLMFDLKTFNVDNLICSSDFDRDFILSAIEAWYGSREAFNAFVRHDLREELLSLLPSPHLPCSYAALILSSPVAWALDFSLSGHKAGLELQFLLPFWISNLAFFIFWFWFALNGVFYLSDRSARSGPNWLLDWCKTLAVAGIMSLFLLIGLFLRNQVVQKYGVVGLVCFTAFSLLLPCFILNFLQTCRRQCIKMLTPSTWGRDSFDMTGS